MAAHSCFLAWRVPRTEEPGGLQSTGSQRVGHDWSPPGTGGCEESGSLSVKTLQLKIPAPEPDCLGSTPGSIHRDLDVRIILDLMWWMRGCRFSYYNAWHRAGYHLCSPSYFFFNGGKICNENIILTILNVHFSDIKSIYTVVQASISRTFSSSPNWLSALINKILSPPPAPGPHHLTFCLYSSDSSFCVCLLSLSIMSSGIIHGAAGVRTSFLFKAE